MWAKTPAGSHPSSWPCVSAANCAPRRCTSAPSAPRGPASRPAGATRMIPPHPLESLIGSSGVPCAPTAQADRQVAPGARGTKSSGRAEIHALWSARG